MVNTEIALIAIFGATGTGKTTFVNEASGGELAVGHKSHACTQEVCRSPTFQIDGRSVVLFDTPGFDDTHLSDSEILKRITEFLATSYTSGHRLTGIIYMHRITDIRVGGISRRTFNVFRKLCGKDSLSNVLIVTNMWSDPPTSAELEREAELRDHQDFFQPALQQGATLVRRSRQSTDSAHDIIRLLLSKAPTTMAIQHEIVDQRKVLLDTGAGQVVEEEVAAANAEHRAQVKAVKEEMEAARLEHERRVKQELEELQAKQRQEEAKRKEELAALEKAQAEERARWEREVEKARIEREVVEARERAAREEWEAARRREHEEAERRRHEHERHVAHLQAQANNQPGCVIG